MFNVMTNKIDLGNVTTARRLRLFNLLRDCAGAKLATHEFPLWPTWISCAVAGWITSRVSQLIRVRLRRALCALLFVLVTCEPLLARIALSEKFALTSSQTIAFEGDSIMYGEDLSPTGVRPPINGAPQPRSQFPFPEQVGVLLDNRIKIANRGYPGDRTTDGIARWKNAARVTLVFLMYGTNDLLNFGHHPGGMIDLDTYSKNLQELVSGHFANGEKIVLMTPSPLQDPTIDARLDKYRQAMRDVARTNEIFIIETKTLLQDVTPRWTDGVHLSAASNTAIATYIAGLIRVSDGTQ